MNKKRLFVSTAIPYVNAAPHAGFALEIVQADVIARYNRLIGVDTFFLTGTDENALKNVQAAEKKNIPVKDFVDSNARRFMDLKPTLNLSYDQFMKTTEVKHFKGSQKLWSLTKKDDLYQDIYKGLYCVGCEAFYLPEDLDPDGQCYEHPGTKLEEVEEKNYFFKLSRYQAWLKELIESDTLKIIPEIRKNEILGWIKQGLRDFSVSRSKTRAKGWGVPVPNDPDQILYVWYDALANYITALDFDTNGDLFKTYWLENDNRLHMIGKGITRFHALYWPAMLKSAGLPIPKTIFVHGYITSNGQKISKSLGNIIDPFEQVNKFGTDAVRYYLLKEIPSYGDGDYTEERFKEIYNADLANGLGNLVSRVAKLAENSGLSFTDTVYPKEIYREAQKNALEEFRFNDVLWNIWNTDIKAVDLRIEQEKPWALKGDKLKVSLQEDIDEIRIIGKRLLPFMPQTAQKILDQFKGPEIKSGEVLFPRIK